MPSLPKSSPPCTAPKLAPSPPLMPPPEPPEPVPVPKKEEAANACRRRQSRTSFPQPVHRVDCPHRGGQPGLCHAGAVAGDGARSSPCHQLCRFRAGSAFRSSNSAAVAVLRLSQPPASAHSVSLVAKSCLEPPHSASRQ